MSAHPLVPLSDVSDLRARIDSALTKCALTLVRGAVLLRCRERGVSSEVLALLTSREWSEARAYDERHGLSITDAWQVMAGIGSICAKHRTPMVGDDVAGRLCVECERAPKFTPRQDCPDCEGSCTDRCDAGAGTGWERAEADALGITVSELRNQEAGQ